MGKLMDIKCYRCECVYTDFVDSMVKIGEELRDCGPCEHCTGYGGTVLPPLIPIRTENASSYLDGRRSDGGKMAKLKRVLDAQTEYQKVAFGKAIDGDFVKHRENTREAQKNLKEITEAKS